MQTEEELELATSILVNQVNDVGDEYIDTKEFEIEIEGETQQARQIVAQEETYNRYYVLTGRTGISAFTILYQYDLVATLANLYEQEEGAEIFNSPEFENIEPEDAAEAVIQRIAESDIERLRFELHERISNSNVYSDLTNSENCPLTGFKVMSHLFPLSDDHSIYEFYDAMTAVVSSGEQGARYLTDAFAIEAPKKVEDDEEYSIVFDQEKVF